MHKGGIKLNELPEKEIIKPEKPESPQEFQEEEEVRSESNHRHKNHDMLAELDLSDINQIDDDPVEELKEQNKQYLQSLELEPLHSVSEVLLRQRMREERKQESYRRLDLIRGLEERKIPVIED